MGKEKTKKKKEPTREDIDRFNNNIESFDKKMDEVRRDFIRKSSKSKKSASDLVLTS